MNNRFYLAWLTAALTTVAFGCAGGHADEAQPSGASASERADFIVFALRCSKCHSLARPLNSGIDNDDYWKLYVERMRRQPSSGISVADTIPILRFLHAYSLGERKRKARSVGSFRDEPFASKGAADNAPAQDAGRPAEPSVVR